MGGGYNGLTLTTSGVAANLSSNSSLMLTPPMTQFPWRLIGEAAAGLESRSRSSRFLSSSKLTGTIYGGTGSRANWNEFDIAHEPSPFRPVQCLRNPAVVMMPSAASSLNGFRFLTRS
jgi:hypothetical protein